MSKLPLFGPEIKIESDQTLPVFDCAVAETSQPVVIFAMPESQTVGSLPLICPSVFSTSDTTENEFLTTAAAHVAPVIQGQREVDRIVRKFLLRIKAQDIRIRRVGPVSYTWKHVSDVDPGDTGSDVRWEIRTSGSNIHMGCYDIKPFFRVLSGPFDINKLVQTHKQLLAEMDADSGE